MSESEKILDYARNIFGYSKGPSGPTLAPKSGHGGGLVLASSQHLRNMHAAFILLQLLIAIRNSNR
jgi:hypothetical protein